MAIDLRQSHYRFGFDDGTESSHTFRANEDVDATIPTATTFLLRFCVQEAGGTAASNLAQQFQYNKNAAGWNNIGTASAVAKSVTPSSWANNADCTHRLSGTGTFETTAAGCTTDGSSGGNSNDVAASGNTETECAIQLVDADVANGDTVQFRLTISGPTTTITYTLTPTATVSKALAVSVSDSATLAEGKSVATVHTISKSESVTLTDVITGYYDTISLLESVSVAVVTDTALSLGVSDSIALAESSAVVVSDPQIDKSDTITLTEQVTVINPPFGTINVTENIGVSEAVNIMVALNVSVSDSLTVIDSPFYGVADLDVSVSDSLTLAESKTVTVAAASGVSISVSDSISLTDTLSVGIAGSISKSESITLTDTPTLQMSDLQVTPAGAGLLDNFNRSAQTHLTDDPAWQGVFVAWGATEHGVFGNQVYGSGAAWHSNYYGTLFGPDQEISITVTTVESDGLTVNLYNRIQNPGDLVTCYGAIFDPVGGTVKIERVDDDNTGVFFGTTGSYTIVDGDKIKLRSVGNYHTAWIDHGSGWVLMAEGTESTYNQSGYIGVLSNSNVVRWDDFSGGNVGDTITVADSPSLTLVDNVSKSETVTTSEEVTLAVSTAQVNVSEAASLIDTPLLTLVDNVSVSDSVSTSEAVAAAVSSPPVSVSDTVSLVDAPSVLLIDFVSVSDTASLAEASSVAVSDPQVDTFDTASVSEAVTLSTVNTLSVSESVSTSEASGIDIPIEVIPVGAGLLDNFDRGDSELTDDSRWAGSFVTYADNGHIVLSNELSGPETGTVHSNYFDKVFDPDQEASITIAIADVTTTLALFTRIANPGASVTAYECIYTGDDILRLRRVDTSVTGEQLASTSYTPSNGDKILFRSLGDVHTAYVDTGSGWTQILRAVDDTYSNSGYIGINTAFDNYRVDDFSGGNVVETIYLFDIPTIYVEINASATDSISIGEVAEVRVSDPELSVADSTVLSEAVSLEPLALNLSVSDSTTLSESVTLTVVSAGQVVINTNDSIALDEASSVSVSDPRVSVADSIALSEALSTTLSLAIPVTDSISLSESVSVAIGATTGLTISVSDSVTLAEAKSVTVSALIASTIDSVTTSESVSGKTTLDVSKAESITTGESQAVSTTPRGNTSDSVSTSESVTVILSLAVNKNETVGVSESTLIVIPTLYVAVSDTLGTSESRSVSFPGTDMYVEVSDEITLEEIVEILESLSISIFESAVVNELIRMVGGREEVPTERILNISFEERTFTPFDNRVYQVEAE